MRRAYRWPRPSQSRPRTDATLAALVRYFAKLGSWGFGGPIALAGYVHRDLVDRNGLITPGSVVIMATFAGYLVHGVLAAVVATAAVLLPVYLFVVVPGPLFRPRPARSPAPRS